MSIDYKFGEDKYLEELKRYIDSTYTSHYGGRYQATDMIIDAGHGEGFTIGNIMKYAKRYGKKGGKNRDDIMKIIHYAVIALHVHDEEMKDRANAAAERYPSTLGRPVKNTLVTTLPHIERE